MGLMVDCLKCISSACCRLKIEVDINEYNRLIEVDPIRRNYWDYLKNQQTSLIT